MHIMWDVPKGFAHRFRDRLSVFFSGIKMYILRNLIEKLKERKKRALRYIFPPPIQSI